MKERITKGMLLSAFLFALVFYIFSIRRSMEGQEGENAERVVPFWAVPGKYYNVSGFTQGTTYSITYGTDGEEDFEAEVDSLLKAFSRSLSTYDSLSLISRLNRNEPGVLPDSLIIRVVERSIEISRLTDGAFDITIAPLADAWGFGPGKELDSLSQKTIDSLLAMTGWEKVRIENGQLVKDHPGLRININAIAQGYSCDYIAQCLDQQGIENYMAEIGGEIRARGVNPQGQYWQIGIDRPLDGNIVPGRDMYGIISLNDQALATSGNYRKYTMKDGEKIHHTLNPKTGRPQKNKLLSTTILAPDGMTADALATACMVMGLEKSKELIAQQDNIEALFIYADNKGEIKSFTTKGLAIRLIKEQ